MLPPRATISIVLSLMGTTPLRADPPGRVVECNYDLASVGRDGGSFAFDLRPTVRWPAFRVSAHVRAGAEQARASGCTVYAYFRSTDGIPSRRDRESVLVTCTSAPALERAGFWAIPRAEITTRTGNEKSKLVYQGKAWLWPKPDFSDL